MPPGRKASGFTTGRAKELTKMNKCLATVGLLCGLSAASPGYAADKAYSAAQAMIAVLRQ